MKQESLRNRFYRRLAVLVTKHNGTVLAVCALLTAVLVVSSGRLAMKTSISDMMPQGIPQVEEFEEIIEDFASASTIMIAIDSEERDVEAMKACAEEIAAKLKNLRRIKPSENNRLSLGQKFALLGGEHPVAGVVYDTLDLVRRIDYRIDNDFFAEHGLIIQKPKDLENLLDMYSSLELKTLIANINDNFEKEFIDDSENLATLDGETEAVMGLESLVNYLESIDEFIDTGDSLGIEQAIGEFVTGPEYFISSDNTLLLLMLQPTVSFNEYDDAMNLGYQVVDSLETIAQSWPDLDIGRSGALVLQIDENNALKKDFGWPSVAALFLILFLLIGSFRSWKNPFLSVLVLVTAIVWVAGVLAIILHYLNMMSAVFGIVLIGLGIDFGIHFISGFKDGRENGLSVEESVLYMYQRVGSGVITGGMTSAIVFFSLFLTGFAAFSEMGIAVGTGIVVTLLAMMILLPALIVWDNKGYSVTGNILRKIGLGPLVNLSGAARKPVGRLFGHLRFEPVSEFLQFRFLAAAGRLLGRMPVALVVLAISAVLVFLSIRGGRNIGFEYDMMELEPEGIPAGITQDKILERFEIAPDYAMLKTADLDDCRDKIDKLKKLGNKTGIIGRVDGITEFLPDAGRQKENAGLITLFRERLEKKAIPVSMERQDVEQLRGELTRLHQNIVEIGELSITGSGENNKILRKCDQIVGESDEDSYILALSRKIADLEAAPAVLGSYQRVSARLLREKLLRMTSTEEITLENLPEEISKRYVSPKSGELLVTVYPNANIWEELTLRRFNDLTTKISERITGMPAIMLLFIDLMKDKGRTAILFGACAIFLLLMADFRSLVHTLFAAIPLAVGAIWMVGLMALFDIKFNISNFMALPLIIGIGIDDGVHVLHRYRIEGRASTPVVLKFTGRAILLTSLTTMIGFGSMGLASHRGIAGMGQVLVLGVGSCFMSSAFVLPALITVIERIVPAKKDSRVS